MKTSRVFEFICVPWALACVGWYATPFTAKLLGLLGRQYHWTNVSDAFRPVFMTCACGLAAGVAAVVSRRRREASGRWSFYALLGCSVPIGAAVIFLVEAVRPRGVGALGFPAPGPYVSSIPFWILAVGFWLPFLILPLKKKPNPENGRHPKP